MKKRLLAAFACLRMLLTLLPAAVFAEEGEVEPGVEPKAVTVDPAGYEYDPNYRDQFSAPDACFTVQRDAGVEITGVTAQNQQGETIALTKGTEYRVSAWTGELIIDNNYMSGLPLNSTTQLTVTLSDGTTAAAQPTATAQPAAAQAPQTGDSSSMLAWLGFAGAAVCGLVALERLRKKG